MPPYTATPLWAAARRSTRLAALTLPCLLNTAIANELQAFRARLEDNDRLTVTLQFTDANISARSFTLSDPPRLVIDFADTRNATGKRQAEIGLAPLRDMQLIQGDDRTRIILNLSGGVDRHDLTQHGNRLHITLSSRQPPATQRRAAASARPKTPATNADRAADAVPTPAVERLSLNFQDITTRAALQVIAELTGLNIVVSDSVTGNLTLRLHDVPWEQALKLILQSQGLGMRRHDPVILVAPLAELADREQQAWASQRQRTDLAPLRSRLFRIQYAQAEHLGAMLTGSRSGPSGDDATTTAAGLLSARGRAIVDARTNALIVYDTAKRLQAVQTLIDQLDVPVEQVLIESRLVTVEKNLFRSLGARFGYAGNYTLTGGANLFIGGANAGFLDLSSGAGVQTDGLEALITSFPAAASGDIDPASMVVLLGATGRRLLQLELSALEQDNRAETISTPRVITANQQQATISRGFLIPFQEASSSGATATSFQQASLRLTVTPQITPDHAVIMAIEVTDDAPVAGSANISTNHINTTVQVNNGDTVVLGGIFRENRSNITNKLPVLGDLPLVGGLFRNQQRMAAESELLVFITPQILPRADSAR